MYDFAVLAVPLAFLYGDRAFDRLEWAGTIAANLLFIGFAIVQAPVGPAIVAIVLALVLRRAVPDLRQSVAQHAIQLNLAR
jgi:O-antigen/teichoic acid export membrane protein